MSNWNNKGIFKKIFETLCIDWDPEIFAVDSTYVRAHQHAAGARKSDKLKAQAADDFEIVKKN